MPSTTISNQRLLPAIASILSIAACGTESRPAVVTIDTLPGGIVRTVSSAPADSGQWRLVLERSIQPEEGSPGELGTPGPMALADDGTLFITDHDVKAIKVFGPDGAWLRTIGRDGAGPGEFQTGGIELALIGDTLIADDPMAARMTLFNTSGTTPLAIHPTACCNYTRIGIDGSGRVVVPTIDGSAGTEVVIRIDPATGTGDTVAVPIIPTADDARWNYVENGMRRFSSTPPFLPTNFTVADPQGELMIAWGGDYRIARVRSGGDTASIFGRSHTPRTIDETIRRAAVEDRIASNKRYWPEEGLRAAFLLDKVPTIYPAFEQIDVDRSGRTWIRLSSPDSTHVMIDLFDHEGTWLDQVVIPSSGWTRNRWDPVAWSVDRVAVATTNDEDLPIIHIYRIERNPR